MTRCIDSTTFVIKSDSVLEAWVGTERRATRLLSTPDERCQLSPMTDEIVRKKSRSGTLRQIGAAAMLRATRQRERRVLTTGAPLTAEEQVSQENQCFAVIQRVVMVSYASV